MVKNPVMFVVEVGSVLTTLLWLRDLVAPPAGAAPAWFTGSVSLWLWFTVLFANFAEALAEGRGKAQAAALRGPAQGDDGARRSSTAREEQVPASELRKGDVVVVEAGQLIPGDGEVIEGIASVDESAITGESAPVIRESGGDRSAVTGGTRVLSDRIVVRIAVEPGRVVPRPHDRPRRGRQAAEDARTRSRCTSCSSGMTIIFLIACVTLVPFGIYSGLRSLRDRHRGAARLPDPDHHRRPAVRHRHRRHGPPDPPQHHPDERARRGGGGRRRHHPARQDGHHHARQPHGERLPPRARRAGRRSWPSAAQLASLADETPEGRSIVVLAKEKFGLRGARSARSRARRSFPSPRRRA